PHSILTLRGRRHEALSSSARTSCEPARARSAPPRLRPASRRSAVRSALRASRRRGGSFRVSPSSSSLPSFAARALELCVERVEPVCPERPVAREPFVQLGEWRGVERVDALLALRPRL